MSPITSILLSTLAALSAVNAYPQQQYQSSMATSTTAAAATGTAAPAPAANNDELIAKLLSKSTAVKRFQTLLTENGKLIAADKLKDKIVFDFNSKAAAAPGSKGGKVAAANIDSFPILTDLGISTTLGFLNACGINTPHVHPRATEFLTVVEGSVDVGMILENGLVTAGNPAEVAGSLEKFQGTVFPQGSIHYQFNSKCEPAVFVATLNSEDPGTNQVAQGFFGLNGEVVNATLGFPKTLNGKDLESFRKDIPANLAQAVETCVKKCEGKN